MDKPNYLLPIKDTLSVAWEKVRGTKGSIIAAFLLTFIILFLAGFIEGIIKNFSPALSFVIGLIAQVLQMLLQAGLVFLGLQRAFDRDFSYKSLFHPFHFELALRIIILNILQFFILLPAIILIALGTTINMQPNSSFVATTIGSLFDVIGTIGIIFLLMRLATTLGFVLEKNLGPWDAIKSSFKVTRENVWRLIGITIIASLIVAISAIPLGIGLIWTIPFSLILAGMIYKRLLANLT